MSCQRTVLNVVGLIWYSSLCSVAKDYVRLLKFGDSLYRCKTLKRAALGRYSFFISFMFSLNVLCCFFHLGIDR